MTEKQREDFWIVVAGLVLLVILLLAARTDIEDYEIDPQLQVEMEIHNGHN